MQKQKAEYAELFGTDFPQTFVSGRTKEGDILIMRAHQAAKKAMKEVKPELQIGLTLSLHDIQAQAGGEEEAVKEWEEEFLHYLPYIKEDDFFGLQNYTRSLIGPDGIPVLGYMYWSLLDNFEWQKGFGMTFGLIAVDRKTRTRHPKESLKVLGSYKEQ